MPSVPPSRSAGAHGRASVSPEHVISGPLPPRVEPPQSGGGLRRTVIAAAFAVVLVAALGFYFVARSAQGPTSAGGAPFASAGAAASAANGRDPSGVPMPQGDVSGWHQTFADDFTGRLTAKWGLYDGQPGGDPAGWFDSTHVTESGGMAVISAYQQNTPTGFHYATGGMSNSKVFSQTYGRFMVRFRADAGYGVAYTLLLWPTNNQFPPEIDFMEDNGKARSGSSATLHYGSRNTIVKADVAADFTKWHTAELVWKKGSLVYLLDGVIWATMTNSNVSSIPMSLAIQTQTWPCGLGWEACPNTATPPRVDLDIDWVVAYTATG